MRTTRYAATLRGSVAGLLALLAGNSLGPAPALAQEDDPPAAQDAAESATEESQGDVELAPVEVEAVRPSPFGPTPGYAPERSATATRLNLSLDETPASVQVVPRQVLEDSGAERVEDALDFTAGVNRTNSFGNTQDGFLLRGFDATFAEDGVVSGGAVANIFGKRDSATVERVEVLRGPAAALYGPGSPGGVVNVVTKRPQATTFARSDSTLSSFERYRQTFDANSDFGTDGTVMARLSGSLEKSDSFRDDIDGDRQVIAPAVTLQPSDDLRVRYRGEFSRDARPFDRGVPVAGSDVLADEDTFFGDPDAGNFTNQIARNQIEAELDLNDAWTARVFGGLTFNSLDGFARSPVALAPFSLPPQVLGVPIAENETIFRESRDRDFQTQLWTGRVELDGRFDTGPVAHETLVSFEGRVVHDDRNLSRSNVFGQPDLISASQPGSPLPAPTPTQRSDTRDDVTNFGFLAFDKITPWEPLTIVGGGRVDIVDQEQTLTTNFGSTETDLNETEFSPTVGAVFQPVSWGSVFVRYAESFEVNTATGPDGSPLDPQEGESIEGGVRFNLNEEALRATVTVFDTDLENVPFADVSTGLSRGASQSSTGVEVSLQGAVTEHLSVIANYTYTDAEVSDLPGPGLEGDFDAPGVPEHAANAFANYSFDSGELDGLSLNGGVVFNGDRLNALPQFVQTPQGLPSARIGGQDLDSFVRFDIGAGYRLNDWVQASFRVENLFDKDYERPGTPNFALPESPRTFSGRLSLRF